MDIRHKITDFDAWKTTCKHIYYHYAGKPTDGTDESFYLSKGKWTDGHGNQTDKQSIKELVREKRFTARRVYRIGYYYLNK